jgi:diguanylate cyclase (GGDEF)-like protein
LEEHLTFSPTMNRLWIEHPDAAAQETLQRSARLIAEERFVAARALVSNLSDDPYFRLHLALCDLGTNQVQRALDAASKAAASFAKMGQATAEIYARAIQTQAATRDGRIQEAIESGLLARRLAAGVPTGPWTALALASLAEAHAWTQGIAAGRRLFVESGQYLDQPDTGNTRAEILTGELWGELVALHQAREPDAPLQLENFEKLLVEAEQLAFDDDFKALTLGRRGVVRRSLRLARGLLHCWQGNADGAGEIAARLGKEVETLQHFDWIHAAIVWLEVEIALAAGNLSHASALAERLVDLSGDVQHRPFATLACQVAAMVHKHSGRFDLAFETMQRQLHAETLARNRELIRHEELVEVRLEARKLTERAGHFEARAQEYRRLAYEDPLTRIANKRRFDEVLPAWLAHSADTGEPLALAMIDVDRFKQINDEFLHTTGDIVLHALARIMQSQIRAQDLAARFGGDEFAILFRNANAATAQQVCERMAQAVRDHDWQSVKKNLSVSMSFGVIDTRKSDKTQDVINRGDELMYERKRARKRSETAFLEPSATISSTILARVGRLLDGKKKVLVLVGNGASVTRSGWASGESFGAWRFADRQRLGSAAGLTDDPAAFLEFWHEQRAEAAALSPTPLHEAVLAFTKSDLDVVVATESADGLLGKVGVPEVLELYGNVHRWYCMSCKTQARDPDSPCEGCGAPVERLRPDVTLLGEFPQQALARAELDAKQADLIIVINSDADIDASISMLEKARSRDVPVLMLGAGPYTKRSLADICASGDPAVFLDALRERLSAPQPAPEIELSLEGSRALDFLTGMGADHQGRTLGLTLLFSDREIRHYEDITPWQFPLTTRSRSCPQAPMPAEHDFAILAQDDAAREGVRRAFLRMLHFFGFVWRDDKIELLQHWAHHFDHWARMAGSHDQRISRMLGSMCLFGLRTEAEAFLAVLEREVPLNRARGTETALAHWRQALAN